MHRADLIGARRELAAPRDGVQPARLSSSKVLARIRAQTFRSGMYIVFVSGL